MPSRLAGDERHHHRVGEDGGKLGADDGETEGDQHDRREIGAAGSGKPQAEQPDHQEHGEEGDPRFAVLACIGDGAEHRRKRRGDQFGDAGGVGPQRRAMRRIGHEAVDEIGREQEGDDERVERLRRPVEQHPADQRALSRRAPTLAPLQLEAGYGRPYSSSTIRWLGSSFRSALPGGKCLARILPQRSTARTKPSVAEPRAR